MALVFLILGIMSAAAALGFFAAALIRRSGWLVKNGCICALLVIVCFVGRLTAATAEPSGSVDATHITRAPVSATSLPEPAPEYYVASKNSDKYHVPDCGSARNISEQNKIYFDTAEDAEAAGRSPCGVCLSEG